ncbi:hypothetical protein [Phenylobacterium sp.]|uniref:hypothetical protein n=1 Tax=Phenylobacterium sp. TaxID=1871053 RepID=UPI001999DCBE|nr:hypothetical protein [Phenylobacterium sp.]MBC7168867.1 hypothetical protein [Phenylobacterium sp.]
MAFVSRIFGAIDRTFLARAYVISVAIAGLMLWVVSQADAETKPGYGFYASVAVNAALFPFAKLVWNELRDFLMGDNFVIANAFLVFGMKFFVNFMLWASAMFVAPVGVAYLWFRTRTA